MYLLQLVGVMLRKNKNETKPQIIKVICNEIYTSPGFNFQRLIYNISNEYNRKEEFFFAY